MKITVVSGRSNPKRDVVELPDDATLGVLKQRYKPNVSYHRKSFKFQGADGKPAVTLYGDAKTLSALGISSGSEVLFKDLGPQIGYRTVFVVEYAGPIAFMILYALRPSFIYDAKLTAAHPLGDVQKMFIGAFLAHFVKRELETFFVHKFSRPTMPLTNIFKNSAYYWLFAAFIGYFLCHPLYTAPTHGLTNLSLIAMAVFELGNFAVHLQLSNMRGKEGDTTRKPPVGGFFGMVSCPNYTFEVLTWVAFSTGTNILMSWGFTLVGLLQMTDWALKKHRDYVKIDPQLKKRKSIIPFII